MKYPGSCECMLSFLQYTKTNCGRVAGAEGRGRRTPREVHQQDSRVPQVSTHRETHFSQRKALDVFFWTSVATFKSTLCLSAFREREKQPRFAERSSFEYDFCQKWKELYRMEEEQRKQLAQQMEEACLKLEMEMEAAAHEYQAMLLRQGQSKRGRNLKRWGVNNNGDDRVKTLQPQMSRRKRETRCLLSFRFAEKARRIAANGRAAQN